MDEKQQKAVRPVGPWMLAVGGIVALVVAAIVGLVGRQARGEFGPKGCGSAWLPVAPISFADYTDACDRARSLPLVWSMVLIGLGVSLVLVAVVVATLTRGPVER